MSVFVDTNVLIRHLTGQPPEQAKRATKFLAEERVLLLPDVIVAEVVLVLGSSVYQQPRSRVAELTRSIIAFPSVVVEDPAMLLRALEVYETDRLDFADAYLIAQAERSEHRTVVSFDKKLGRVGTVKRVEPS